MPISQQPDMIETWFKNWQVQENQLYKLGKRGGALIRTGRLLQWIQYVYIPAKECKNKLLGTNLEEHKKMTRPLKLLGKQKPLVILYLSVTSYWNCTKLFDFTLYVICLWTLDTKFNTLTNFVRIPLTYYTYFIMRKETV